MNTFPLCVRPLPTPPNGATPGPAPRAAAAWLLIEPSPARWLDEVAGWGAPLEDWRLYVAPVGPRDLSPKGVLCVPRPGAKVVPSPRAIPLAIFAGRLYAPLDARFDPPVSDDELESRLVGRVSLLLPPDELIAFDAEDALSPADLLVPPPERWTDWTRADPGDSPAPRLTRVEPLAPPSITLILSEGADGIGSRPLDEAPPTPEEKSAGALSKLGSALGQGATAGLGSLLAGLQKASELLGSSGKKNKDKEGETAGSENAGNATGTGAGQGAGAGDGAAGGSVWGKVQEWLGSAQQALAASVYSAQRRELERLLHLLQTNPDEGLRYALPQAQRGDRQLNFGGVGGSRLSEHSVDFNLGRLLGSSGPGVVTWYGFDDIQRKLEEHYRRLAEREIQLGRHRRAAYIYAELLADLRSAAEALVAGKHYREAAVLYRDRLHAPRQAAECLENGGLIVEAIELYEGLRDYLKVGDLYTRLERIPEARRAYKEAVAARRSAKDFLGAADVHITRLQEPDQALQLLALAWPWSEQAAACLRRRFALLGELGRSEEAQRLVTRLRDECTDRRVAVLAAELATVVETYPDRAVREGAADATRVVVGGRLPHVNDDEARTLVAVLARLAPEDRLLQRDGVRWADRRASERKAAAPGRPTPSAIRASKRGRVTQLGFFKLPPHVAWRSFVGTNEGYWAAGYSTNPSSRGELTVAAGRWADVVLRPPGAERDDDSTDGIGRMRIAPAGYVVGRWPDFPQPRRDYPILLQPHFPHDRATLLALLGGPSVPVTTLTLPTGAAPHAQFAVGSPPVNPEGLLGAAFGDLRTLWVLLAQGETTLINVYGEEGKLVRSRDLHLPANVYFQFPATRHLRPIPMLARAGATLTAAGKYLLRVGPLSDLETFPARSSELPGVIGDLAAPASASTLSAAAALETGVAYVPDVERLDDWWEIGSEIHQPSLAFTRSGRLVVAGAGALEVYERIEGRDGLRLVDGAPGEGAAPLAATATDFLDRFAVASEDGVVRLYETADRD